MDIHGNGTATRVDTTACMPNGLHGWKSGGTRNITQSDSSQPGFLGYDTPNFSPNGDWIIFGKIERGIIGLLPYGNYVYKVPANGSGGCSVLYEPQSASSSPPTAARYSPDGTKVSLYHVEGFGETAVRKLRIINATTGAIIEDHTPVEFLEMQYGHRAEQRSRTRQATTTQNCNRMSWGNELAPMISRRGRARRSSTQWEPTASGGLSWGTPPAAGPALSLRINQPNPVTSGTSTTATVYLNEPAPTGGVTVSLQALGAIGAMTVPSSVVIAEGETQAVFTIDTEISNLYRSAEVLATRPSPNFAQAQATVSLAPAKPDLRAVSLTVPPAVGVNQGFDISWVVDNIGEASTGTNGGVDAIYLSTDDILTGSDTLLYSQPNPASLAVGASRTVSGFQLSIADYLATQPGLYYLILYTNPFGAIDEAGRTSNNTVTIPIQVNYPDLVIENLAVPANTEPNVPFTVTFNIRNIGGANAANPFNTRISVSTDAFFGNSDDSTLANINLNSLAAGATSAQSRSVTIPTVPSRPNGTIYIFVKADTDNTIIEGSQITPEEINNTSSQTTQFEYRVPDLQVTSTSTAVEVDTDAAFPMTWTTTNTGNKAAGTFSESVYFSPDNQVGSDLLLGTFPLPGGLAAGASVERIQNVTIPTGAIPTSGDHYVYVLTDSPSVINEGENENNNSRFQPVFVRRLLRPDLVITNITAPPTAFFDQTIQVQWTVTNNGLGPTNALAWKDRVSVNTTGSSTTNALIDVDSAGALAPGESYIASATVKIPRGFNGSYLFVVTTDINGALNEENTTNNKLTRAITLNIPPLPDLTVSNVQAPVQAFAGGPINVGWQVNNIGNAAAAGDNEALNKPWSWADKVYLSRDTVLNTSQDRLIFTKSTRTTPLPAGANYTTNTFVATTTGGDYVKLPNDVQGQYYVFVVADTNNTIYEFSAENNNFAYDEVAPGSPINIIQTPPDLVINAQPAAPSTASGGQFIDISFTVSNQGAFPTAGNWTDAIYLSTDQTYGADDTILGTKPTSSLAAGESRLVEMRVQLPTCVLTGDYYLIARTDTGNMVGEFDPGYDAEANNYSPVRPISITTLPADLIASNVQFSPITTPGQSVSVSWTESNIGTGPGPYQWTDRVLITSLEGLGSSEIGRATHQGAIAAGQSASRNANVNLPSYMQGEYVITIETDYNRNVIECGTGEDNNTASSGPFSVANNLPDVVVDSVSVPAGPIQVGTSFPVGYTGRNAGGQLTTFGGWHDVVYLSSDASLSASDIRIGNVSQQDNLAPGQTYSQTVNVSTGNVAAGQYYILVVADIDNNVYEGPYNSIYEGNNLRESTPIIVTSPDVDLQAVVNSVTTPTYSGTNVIINWTVTNTGGTSTLGSSWTDYIILSRDSVIDSTDKRLGYVVHNGALAGGANYSESRSIGIPAGLTDLYRIFVVTDYNNSVSESSDSNNISPAYNVNLELPPPADLNVTNISVPAGATPGDGAFFQWTVQNSGTYPAIGPWRDSVYLSRDQFWDASDYLIGQKDRTGLPLGPSATEVESTGFTIPFIEEGDYYVIVRLDSQNRVRESNEANNVLTSVSQMPITVQALTLNTPFMTTLLNGGQKSFRFDAPADETIVVSLDGETGNSNELFTNFYSAASRADYDFQGSGERTADQENVIGNTYEGRYYSMVSHDFIQPQNVLFDKQPEKVVNGQIGTIPVPPQNISITANLLPFSIRQVSPAVAGNQGEITISVDGAKFASGATVMLVGADTSVITPRITKNSSSRIVALFDLKEKAAGDYDVVVTNPNNQTTTRTDGFKIVNGGGHSLRHSAIGPSAARIGNARARFTFTVHNDGLNDAFAVPLMIAFPTNVAYELDRGNYFDMPAELLPQGMPPMELTFDSDGKRYLF
ncbi:MAG: hypothetical protein IPP63_06690 [Chloracidobacterium sp.]|nr:hypothetical protein [Chloracidobacterium sp.]